MQSTMDQIKQELNGQKRLQSTVVTEKQFSLTKSVVYGKRNSVDSYHWEINIKALYCEDQLAKDAKLRNVEFAIQQINFEITNGPGKCELSLDD